MIRRLLRDPRDFPFVDYWHQICIPAAKQAKPSGKMSGNSFRSQLPIPGMIKRMRERFDRIPDPIDKQTRRGGDPVQARNLHSLFGVETPPPDSCC